MSLSQELDTIKMKCGKLLFLYPELKTAHPNIRLIKYWKVYDGFGEITLIPQELTNYHSIDRAFRYLIPSENKNYEAERIYRETYVKKDQNV